MRHFVIGGTVFQQLLKVLVDGLLLRADEAQRTRSNALGALGRIAHDQYRLAERGSLLLNAAAVGEDQIRAGEEVVEIEHVERLYDADAVAAAELGIRLLADDRVHVDRINGAHIGMLLDDAADGAEHAVHRLAEVLAPSS